MSTAPRKAKAQTQEPEVKPVHSDKAQRAPRKRSRSPTASRDIKDPVLRSEAYTENVMLGSKDRVVALNEGKARAARLRELLEPHNEAMIKVMVDIAMNTDYEKTKDLPDTQRRPSIHPSIRLEAADRLLTRLHGKPKETVVVEDAEGVGSGDEVLGLLNNILTAVGAPLLELPSGDGTM